MTIGFRNISSLIAQNNLGQATSDLKTSYERLSSGQRINSASDDAAGLAVSSKLNLASRVFTQGIRNISDGQSVLNIAEGALHQLSSITSRQTELAEQAANGSYSAVQRKALQTEADALTNEFNRIVKTTSFNGQSILDVNNSAGTIQIQAGFGINNSLSFSTGNELARTVGSGTFDTGQTIFIGTSTSLITKIGDLNGDGLNDIVTFFAEGDTPNGNGSDGAILINMANGDGTFTSTYTSQFVNILDDYSAQLADLNGDGILDLIAGGGNDGGAGATLQISLGRGDGTFAAASDTGINSRGFELGDVDGDGRPELLSFNGTGYNLYQNAGNGSFNLSATYVVGGGNVATFGDLNGDGRKEVITSGSHFGYIDVNGDGFDDQIYIGSSLVAYNNGHGSFGQQQVIGPSSQAVGSVVDLNDDGILDFLGTGSDPNLLSTNDGRYTVTQSGFYSAAATGDLNGDGAPDAVVTNSATGIMTIYHQNTNAKTSVIRSPKISNQIDARNALRGLTDQQQRVEAQLGTIGAAQSRLNTAVSNLTTMSQGYLESAARITDVDVASETANLVKNEIKQQVAASILNSANLEPRLVLKLIGDG